MKLSKPAAIGVLAATALPLLWIFCFFGLIVFIFTRMGNAKNAGPPQEIVILFVGHGCAILLQFALLAFYLVYIFKSRALTDNMRIAWVLAVLFGGAIGMSVFWFIVVWPDANRPLANPLNSESDDDFSNDYDRDHDDFDE